MSSSICVYTGSHLLSFIFFLCPFLTTNKTAFLEGRQTAFPDNKENHRTYKLQGIHSSSLFMASKTDKLPDGSLRILEELKHLSMLQTTMAL
jgi:hypothetical protein